MGRESSAQQQRDNLRPKRKATNAHIFRYLQTRNPIKLEEDDLKRALEASLEECPDFWPEDSASCSSSEQSNATSATASSSGSVGGGGGSGGGVGLGRGKANSMGLIRRKSGTNSKRRSKASSSSSSMRQNHLKYHHNDQSHMHNPYHNLITHHQQHNNNSHSTNTLTANSNCPMSNVHNRYKPVGKKNIYNEADFFHDGIMEYIEFQLKKKLVCPI